MYFWGTLYWLIETMTTFGGLSTAMASFAAALLVGYLALFPAAFAVIVNHCWRVYGVRALLVVPFAWATTELGRQHLWDGFPWALLGYSQVTWLPIAQTASLVGVYGLSWLLALSAAAVASLVLQRGFRRWLPVVVSALLVAVLALWGVARLRENSWTAQGEPVRVAVLQGNVAQEDKWDPSLRDAITDRYLSMSRQALARGATFIIWPESSTPFFFERDLIRGGAVRRLARDSGATFLIGSDQVEPVESSSAKEKPSELYYNAAFLVKPDGEIGGIYRKMHLVPFGEYVPLKSLLFFVGPIVEAVADFSPGRDPVLLSVTGHLASTAICYEVIFPDLIRRFVQEGSELLTTITNDAWYGRSSAAYQHWEHAAMRSIEEGRYLARAANTGVSGFVDPYGRVIEKTGLFDPAVVIADVRFITARTVYSRTGDIIAWLSLVTTLLALAGTKMVRRRS